MAGDAKKAVKIPEQLIVSNGLLKVPSAVRDKYGSARSFPNPDWAIRETDGKVELTYIFDKKQLEKNSKR